MATTWTFLHQPAPGHSRLHQSQYHQQQLVSLYHHCQRSIARCSALAAGALSIGQTPAYVSATLVPPQLGQGHNRISAAMSVDPQQQSGTPNVTTVHSPAEFQDVLAMNPGQLTVLMCKAHGCRPCKMFQRKYQRLAEQFQECIFLDVIGDESTDTRRMMIQNQVKVTPTFLMCRGGKTIGSITGINENNLRNAITDNMRPGERDTAPLD